MESVGKGYSCIVAICFQRRLHFWRSSVEKLTWIVFLVSICIHFSLSAKARGEVDYGKITKSYLEASFQNDYGRLRKFSDVSHLSYDLECNSYSTKKCEPVSDYIRFSLFSAENMKLEQTEHGQLQIIFADENKLSDRALKLTQEFSGGSLDVEDTECQLYLKFSENDITKAAIVLSLDAEPQKIANCLLDSVLELTKP